MASVNVSKMSLKELEDLEVKVQKEISVKRQQARADVVKKMEELAANAGYSMSELVGSKGRGKAKRSAAVARYVNPDNPEETWTGRGRKPNWLVAKMKKGAKQEDFAI